MKIFDYIFYKVYKLINFLGNTDFYPEANAWFISSALFWLNMLTVLGAIELKLEKALTDKAYVIPFSLLYLGFTYIYFLRKDRYTSILEKYDKQTRRQKMLGTIIVTVYILLTIILHLYFSELRRKMG